MRNKILTLIQELQPHKYHNRDELYKKYIEERLTKSFNTYQHDLQVGLEYLKRRDELNVAKKINRLK